MGRRMVTVVVAHRVLLMTSLAIRYVSCGVQQIKTEEPVVMSKVIVRLFIKAFPKLTGFVKAGDDKYEKAEYHQRDTRHR